MERKLTRQVPYVEVTRKLVLAFKKSSAGYFIMIGGTGSLWIPGSDQSVLENKRWWPSYRRAIADSEAHTQYMEERLGPMGNALRAFRNARANVKAGKGTDVDRKIIDEYEESVRVNDRALEFITGARTTFMFFDGNTSFNWTFVSPSALYRPGKRTGKYTVQYDYLPLKGDPNDISNFDDRMHGISAADLAIAIVDEAETPKHTYKHWTAYANMDDDTPYPSYVKIG